MSVKYLLEGLVAEARVNWKADAKSFPTGPLGPLNYSLFTFRLALYNWVGISRLLHSRIFNASHCLLQQHPIFSAGIEDLLRTS